MRANSTERIERDCCVEGVLLLKSLEPLVTDTKLDRQELAEEYLNTDFTCSIDAYEYLCANLLLMLEILRGIDEVSDLLLTATFSDSPPYSDP